MLHDFKDAIRHDARFKAIESDSEKETIFRDFVSVLGKVQSLLIDDACRDLDTRDVHV